MSRLSEFQSQVERIKSYGRVVFTNGCFDILHIGHVRYLAEARRLGDVLVVGVNSDESVRRLKGPTRPLQTESDRAEILLNLKPVDYTFIFDDDTPLRWIEALRPDFLVKGGDWSPDQIVGSDFVASYGGVVKAIPFVEGRSTTGIVQKMQRD